MITVVPDTFTKIHFGHDEIAEVATDLLGRIDGLDADLDVELVVDEDAPTTRWAIASLDPLRIEMDSGTLENTRRPQHFGRELASNSIGAALFQYRDRVDAEFGAPELGEPDEPLLRAAWNTYCYGRVSRLGIRVHRPKHLYNFRNRAGFTDAADAAFDRLWTAADLTYTDIESIAAGD